MWWLILTGEPRVVDPGARTATLLVWRLRYFCNILFALSRFNWLRVPRATVVPKPPEILTFGSAVQSTVCHYPPPWYLCISPSQWSINLCDCEIDSRDWSVLTVTLCSEVCGFLGLSRWLCARWFPRAMRKRVKWVFGCYCGCVVVILWSE